MKNFFLRSFWLLVFSVSLFTGDKIAAQRLQRIINTQTRLIRHEATDYQRKVAEARARAYVAAQRKKAATQSASKKIEQPRRRKSMASMRSDSGNIKLPRYIAVDTVKDERGNSNANKSVMLWDTHAEKLVGNNVYDFVNPPSLGKSARFDTRAAQYIGSGT